MDNIQRKQRPLIRRTRNVASALCFMVCCTFVAFWARSYYQIDRASIRVSSNRSWSIVSEPGRVRFMTTVPPSASMWPSWAAYGWGLSSHHVDLLNGRIATSAAVGWGFGSTIVGTAAAYDAPFWCPILITGILAVALRTRPRLRFSISTLLIVTACLAMVLGMFSMLDHAAAVHPG
jgi:hypothetical protein